MTPEALDAISTCLPSDRVIGELEQLRMYECDGLAGATDGTGSRSPAGPTEVIREVRR
jgi:hypothetical protein